MMDYGTEGLGGIICVLDDRRGSGRVRSNTLCAGWRMKEWKGWVKFFFSSW